MIREVVFDLDHQRLVDEFVSMDVYDFLKKHGNQMSVQHRGVGTDLQLVESCHSLFYDWDAYDQRIHDEPPRKEVMLDEASFTMVCDRFANTYIGDVITRLHETFGAYRGRFMMMKYKTCLSMHVDQSPRLHIPMITNPDCFMVIDGQNYSMEPGKVYIADTRLPHTAVNAGKKDRTHLVFCVRDF